MTRGRLRGSVNSGLGDESLDQRGALAGHPRARDHEVEAGRVETTQMWGRPESVRQEFRRIRAQ